MTVRAPAKINLVLAVGARRPDGYHELTTVFHAVALYDELQLTRTAMGGPTVEVTGEGAAEVPVDDGNLAVRAASLLAEHTGAPPAVAMTLTKGIPVAGGCAGGSADAAAALVGCDALWGTGLARAELEALAARLGSDVAFGLHGGTALGTGRGERITPVLGRGSYRWVLALGEEGLSTPAVYAELDRRRASGPVRLRSDPEQGLAALRSGDQVALGRALCNDLQPAAISLRPGLRQLLEAGNALGALGAVVSGSGPTVAFLVPDAATSAALAAALPAVPGCRAAREAVGPVSGATVVAAH